MASCLTPQLLKAQGCVLLLVICVMPVWCALPAHCRFAAMLNHFVAAIHRHDHASHGK